MRLLNPTLWHLAAQACAAALSCIASANVVAAPLAVRPLDFRPVDVSADGSVVTGGLLLESIVWNSATGSRQEIPLIPTFNPDGYFSSEARGISADGSVVVGTVQPVFTDGLDAAEAFRWTAATKTTSLGTKVGGREMYTRASGVSADGSVVVGSSWGRGVNGHWDFAAFRWTADSGMIPLSGIHFASAMSDDGTTVVGAWSEAPGSQTAHRSEAVRWSADKGAIRLGTLPGDNISGATDVSADGSVVVGTSYKYWDNDRGFEYSDPHLFRWTEAGGMADLGRIAPVAMSADGSVIVGNCGPEALIWDEAHGIRPLRDATTSLGVDLGGWELESVRGISGDGRTVIGYGHDPSGNASGWIITVPEPAGLLLAMLLAPALLHRRLH